jgi:hypothetical protein
VLLQAAVFGVLRVNGFPRGWIGVGLAFAFGLLMGLIRRGTGGRVAHICTEVVIVAIVLLVARGN